MEKKEYPKWVYHAKKAPRVVADKEAHEALGEDWSEAPAPTLSATELEDLEDSEASEEVPKKRHSKVKESEQ